MATNAIESLIVRNSFATNPYATSSNDETSTATKTQGKSSKKSENIDNLNNRKTNYDVDLMYDEFKNNPMELIKTLGLKFTDEQLNELSNILKTEDGLKAFLNAAKQKDLDENDIIAITQKAISQNKGFWKKVGGFFETLFDKGIDDAIEYVDSTKAYAAKTMSKCASDIKRVRGDFKAETCAEIAEYCLEHEDAQEHLNHYIYRKDHDTYLYKEENIQEILEYLKTHPEEAEKLMINAQVLENITFEDGKIKYKGETIVNVAKRMTDAPELKDTMLNIAQKSDMTDEILNTSTENLYLNPEMQSTLDFMCKHKNKDGTDRFSANNILDTSSYLLEQDKEFCKNYYNNIMEIANNSNCNGNTILDITQLVTENPTEKENIYSNYGIEYCSTNEVQNNTINYQENYTKDDTDQTQNNATQTNINNQIINNNGQINQENYIINNNEENKSNVIVINGDNYDKDELKQVMQRKFGYGITDAIIEKLETDSDFIQKIKSLNLNRELLKAYIEDPEKVLKIKRDAKMANNTQLTEIYEFATNNRRLNTILELVKYYNISTAINIVEESKFNYTEEATNDILNDNTLNSNAKMSKIEQTINV